MKFRYSALILILALAACGQAPGTTYTAATAPAHSSAGITAEEHGPGKEFVVLEYDAASVLLTLDLMRGHLVSSLETVGIGDYASAQQHAAQPIAKHYGQIKSEVQQADTALDAELTAVLTTYQQQLEARADIATIEQSTAEIQTVLDKIEKVLVPIHTDVHSRAIAGVIESATEKYEESIKDSAFVVPIAYQDAFGFTRVAEAHFARIKPDLGPEAAHTTQVALDTLKAAMPTIKPPQTVVKPVDEVVGTTSKVGDHLGRIQRAGGDAAALEASLNRLSESLLAEIDRAIDQQDVAAARAAWAAFDTGWGVIEDDVRERSQERYQAIERTMDEVEHAIMRTDSPTAADVSATTGALRAEIETFVETLK